ncbi:MAG: phosphoribosylglycinamide formyltransferase [Armatimonadota bacterium]
MDKEKNKTTLAVLISGEGTNLQAIIDSISAGRLPAEIKVVISNKEKAGGLKKAEKANIPTRVLSRIKYKTNDDYCNELAKLIKGYNVDLIVLAGFLLILSENFVKEFEGKIINLHPAILPDNIEDDNIVLPDGTVSPVFRGLDTIEKAFKSGTTYTGCSVHKVTPYVDRGKVIIKEIIKIDKNDTLESLTKKMRKKEHKILPEAIRILIDE